MKRASTTAAGTIPNDSSAADRVRTALALALTTTIVFGLAAAPAWGQDHSAHQGHQGHSPYTEMVSREIKALSAEEIAGLESGAGMSMALAAELNGMPGPLHVLELADEMELTADQRDAVQLVFDEMQAAARTLGSRRIELERSLDEGLAARSLSSVELRDILLQIGEVQAQLRFEHLNAHVRLVPILSDAQRASYDMLRGYTHARHTGG